MRKYVESLKRNSLEMSGEVPHHFSLALIRSPLYAKELEGLQFVILPRTLWTPKFEERESS